MLLYYYYQVIRITNSESANNCVTAKTYLTHTHMCHMRIMQRLNVTQWHNKTVEECNNGGSLWYCNGTCLIRESTWSGQQNTSSLTQLLLLKWDGVLSNADKYLWSAYKTSFVIRKSLLRTPFLIVIQLLCFCMHYRISRIIMWLVESKTDLVLWIF